MKVTKRIVLGFLSLLLVFSIGSGVAVSARDMDEDIYAITNFSMYEDDSPLQDELARAIWNVQNLVGMAGREWPDGYIENVIETAAAAIEVYETRDASDIELHYQITKLDLAVCQYYENTTLQDELEEELETANELLAKPEISEYTDEYTDTLIDTIGKALEVYKARRPLSHTYIATDEEIENAVKGLKLAVQGAPAEEIAACFSTHDEPTEAEEPTGQTQPDDVTEPTKIDYPTGDVNLNGVLDITDATYIQRYLARLQDLSDISLSLGDVNHDGLTNIVDATIIQRCLAGLETLDE